MKLAGCHEGRAHYARGLCRPCYELELRHRNPDFAARQRANSKEWARRNPERKAAVDLTYQLDPRNRERAALNDRARTLALFGLTLADEESLLAAQGGGCGSCGGPPGGRWFHLDHCHATGSVRGLLCGKCNKGIGLLSDNAAGLRRALAYLERPPVSRR